VHASNRRVQDALQGRLVEPPLGCTKACDGQIVPADPGSAVCGVSRAEQPKSESGTTSLRLLRILDEGERKGGFNKSRGEPSEGVRAPDRGACSSNTSSTDVAYSSIEGSFEQVITPARGLEGDTLLDRDFESSTNLPLRHKESPVSAARSAL